MACTRRTKTAGSPATWPRASSRTIGEPRPGAGACTLRHATTPLITPRHAAGRNLRDCGRADRQQASGSHLGHFAVWPGGRCGPCGQSDSLVHPEHVGVWRALVAERSTHGKGRNRSPPRRCPVSMRPGAKSIGRVSGGKTRRAVTPARSLQSPQIHYFYGRRCRYSALTLTNTSPF